MKYCPPSCATSPPLGGTGRIAITRIRLRVIRGHRNGGMPQRRGRSLRERPGFLMIFTEQKKGIGRYRVQAIVYLFSQTSRCSNLAESSSCRAKARGRSSSYAPCSSIRLSCRACPPPGIRCSCDTTTGRIDSSGRTTVSRTPADITHADNAGRGVWWLRTGFY